jgi:hypothetical protein
MFLVIWFPLLPSGEKMPVRADEGVSDDRSERPER